MKKRIFLILGLIAAVGLIPASAWAADDQSVRTNVMDALSAEPVFQEHGITADVHGGVVDLRGTVASESEKELATQIAEKAGGASRVQNRITVDPHMQSQNSASF